MLSKVYPTEAMNTVRRQVWDDWLWSKGLELTVILLMRFPGARVDLHGELLGTTGLSSNISLSYQEYHVSPASLIPTAFLISEQRTATQKYIITDFLEILLQKYWKRIIEGMQSFE